MDYKIVVDRYAHQDIVEILDWYAARSLAASNNFLIRLGKRLKVIAQRPESFGMVRLRPKYRKAKVERYPYHIVFRVDERKRIVTVTTVVHVKRNPTVWVKRLK